MVYIETSKYNIDSNGNSYGAAIYKQYHGSTATEAFQKVATAREHNDMAKFTCIKIIDIYEV
jgi:hypothetical protein